MTDLPHECGNGPDHVLADVVAQSISAAANGSERSRQSDNHVLGVSDIGHCREYARRMILNEPYTDSQDRYDLASFVGTAVGDKAEDAVIASGMLDRCEKQLEVRVDIGIVTLVGHPDLVHSMGVIDFKTVDGLAVIRKTGKSTKQKFQLTLYAKALIDNGYVFDTPSGLPELSLVWIDRSGVDLTPHVETWLYNKADVDEARLWVEDVVYAVTNREETSRDAPREFCWACCPYVTACRGTDTDVEGLIEDETVLAAVEVYNEASARIKAAEKDKKDAAAALRGIAGSTGSHTVRWIDIPESEMKAYTRAGYQRLDLRPIRRATK